MKSVVVHSPPLDGHWIEINAKVYPKGLVWFQSQLFTLYSLSIMTYHTMFDFNCYKLYHVWFQWQQISPCSLLILVIFTCEQTKSSSISLLCFHSLMIKINQGRLDLVLVHFQCIDWGPVLFHLPPFDPFINSFAPIKAVFKYNWCLFDAV